MKNVPVIKDGNTREIYQALSKCAKLLIGNERFLRVVDGAINLDTGSFDVAAMARTLNNELEDKAATTITNNYGVKKEAPESRTVRDFDNIGDPNALKSFDGVSDEAFIRGLTNPSVSFR